MYLESISISAGADLSSHRYKPVQIDGTLATAPVNAVGILQNKPAASGRDASVGYLGRSRYIAGAAITAGNRVTLNSSSFFVACGSNELGIGTALTTVASGEVSEGIFNFVGAKTEVVSAHLA